MTDLVAQVEALRTQLHKVQNESEYELRQARMEATRMRKSLRMNNNAAKIANRAYRDAILFHADLLAGHDIGRDAMLYRHGWSQRRWEWCRALLVQSGVANSRYRIVEFDGATAQRVLKHARERAIDNPEALRRHLPLFRQRELGLGTRYGSG